MNKKKMSPHAWYKIFVYVAMIVFAISIIVPVAWVFLSSVKSQLDLVGRPLVHADTVSVEQFC